ncbi:MAG TPA: shikimate kinase [Salinimicrobium sp.]|nr:shikimate kinase [Salinimicrobium sp.]
MKIIFMGYMGSGKSRVGEALAQSLDVDYLDLDQLISRSEEKEISQIFEDSGEIYFRRKEYEVLEETLALNKEYVLSLGGGTPCFGKNLEKIKQTPGVNLVYLKTSIGELTKRLFPEKESRPLISHLQSKADLEDYIRKHLFERGFYYNQADHIISTDSKEIREISSEITEKLK